MDGEAERFQPIGLPDRHPGRNIPVHQGPTMAGDQQHYLAQFLLCPFACGVGGRKPSVHVFHRERGHEPHQSVKKIARERHMYGPPDGELDRAITEREATHAPLIHGICESGTVPPGSFAQLAEFAALYVTRTRAARDLASRAVQAAWMKCCDAFSDPDISRRELGRAFDEKPSDFLKFARKAAGGRHLTGPEILAFRKALVGIRPGSLPVMRQAAASFDEREARQKAHRDALRSLVFGKPGLRSQRYREFAWSVVRVATGNLILGDVGPIVFGRNSGLFVSFVELPSEVGGLVIPLAPHVALLGQVPGTTLPALDADTLNRASAEWSVEMFVSATATANEHGLRQMIASRAEGAFDRHLQHLEEQLRTGTPKREGRRHEAQP